MSLAKVTALGFEQLLKHDGTSLFADAVFPPSLDRDTLINQCLLRAGEFEVVYENPYFMRDYITSWAKSFYRTFEKWANAYFEDYKPLENYNRTEIWDDKVDNTDKTEAHSGIKGETVNTVSAYDSNDFVNKDKSNTSSTNNSNGQSVLDGKTHHEGSIYGNIGVTTSQQMLEAEYEVARFNVYEQIAKLFIKEFCICVY